MASIEVDAVGLSRLAFYCENRQFHIRACRKARRAVAAVRLVVRFGQ